MSLDCLDLMTYCREKGKFQTLLLVEICRTVSYWLRGAKIHYTGIYNTHVIDPMYALKVCRVKDIYRKAVNDNTPGVSYIIKFGLRCDPSGPNDVIHWCSDHATKVALYNPNDGTERVTDH